MKRLFDLTLTILFFFLCAPLIVLLAVLVYINLGTPIFFYQVRPGLQGKPFTLCKFRTMTEQKNSSGENLPDEQRMTSFGRFLRSTSLDELPELWNVLKGDMSLVGPRPLLMDYLPLYTDEQYKRHKVRPGVTGWAQVNGRNAVSWEKRFEMDVWYVNNQSFWLDLKIIFMTVIKVILREGISENGKATMSKFSGENR